MPAAVRGVGRGSAKARSKSSSSPLKSRGPAKPAAATRAPSRPGLAIAPRVVAAGVAVALVGALAVAAFTDHRAERAIVAAQSTLVQRSAQVGLRLENVKLEGASAKSAADILRSAALPSHAPLLTVDLDGARRRIEQVGWVKSARVMRLLPDTVVIAVEERQLLAVWQHAGRTAVIDGDGVAAPEADPNRFANLPLVVGEGANTAAAAILPLVLARPRLTDRLEALVRVDDRRWDLRLKDGCIIQLPASDEEAALIKLDQLDQQSRLLDLGFSRIDLRDPEMVLVRPRETSAAKVSDGPDETGDTGGTGGLRQG